jgi:hypothetical protein
MQVPGNDEALQGLHGYEQMVDTFAEQAKAYWSRGVRWASRWSAV